MGVSSRQRNARTVVPRMLEAPRGAPERAGGVCSAEDTWAGDEE